MNYGYVRVSTTTQNIARQMDELYKMGISGEAIFIDYDILLVYLRVHPIN